MCAAKDAQLTRLVSYNHHIAWLVRNEAAHRDRFWANVFHLLDDKIIRETDLLDPDRGVLWYEDLTLGFFAIDYAFVVFQRKLRCIEISLTKFDPRGTH